MKKAEQLKEGWVNFTRFYCKEGFIDKWFGDCINDPNRPNKLSIQLNAFATYYRLNSDKWEPRLSVGRNIEDLIHANHKTKTAPQIWAASKSEIKF